MTDDNETKNYGLDTISSSKPKQKGNKSANRTRENGQEIISNEVDLEDYRTAHGNSPFRGPNNSSQENNKHKR